MPADARISALIENALAAGIPQQSLVGMLSARGWPDKEIYDALAEYYQRVNGLEIPRRAGAGAAAKDAFFYLLLFSTLATWSISFGLLASALIDRWFVDTLFSPWQQGFDTYTITSSLAAVIVAFPLFLLISRAVAVDTALHPEKLDSSIRKWLTYMALVIAAGVFMGDLITALAFLLRGELTSRFLAKAFVVFLLSGGVFFYYFGGLRKSADAAARKQRDRLIAALSSAAVILIVVLGFVNMGAPARQRAMRADRQRVQELYQLSNGIQRYWNAHDSQLPAGLDQLPLRRSDPITHQPYDFHARQGSQYELCANFASSSRNSDEPQTDAAADQWIHPAGHHCFQLDANMQSPSPGSPVQY